MKLDEAIGRLGAQHSMSTAREVAEALGVSWNGGAEYIFSVIVNDPDRVPQNIGGKYDNEQSVIEKWVRKYKKGFDSRASMRKSNPLGTIADPIIKEIIGSRLNQLTPLDLNKIESAHRLAMSAENILGLLLEEYLSVNLSESGWHCAWGETVKSVDFVHEDGRLLQIKNRSNSENSSSSSVRNGTDIKKWYRIEAGSVIYKWDVLNQICNTTELSEPSFSDFLKRTVLSNPDCLYVEQGNDWFCDN